MLRRAFVETDALCISGDRLSCCSASSGTSTIHSMSSDLPGFEQAAAVVSGRAAQLRKLRPRIERVDLAAAAGRVLAQPICADRDQPHLPAQRATVLPAALRTLPRIGSCTSQAPPRPEQASSGPLDPGAAWEIMTGAPVPAGTDAVMMIEHVDVANGQVRLAPPRSVTQGENIVAQGAQAREGDELLAASTPITFAQVALAAECGYSRDRRLRPASRGDPYHRRRTRSR